MVYKVSLLMMVTVLVTIVSAGHPQHGGHSNSFRKQDDHGNYAFGYDIKDPKGASNYRKESGDGHGNKWGSYGLADIDGRWRTVEYVADKGGFKAQIKTNEPGTGNADAAAATFNGPDAHGGSHSNQVTGHHAPNHNEGGHGQGITEQRAHSLKNGAFQGLGAQEGRPGQGGIDHNSDRNYGGHGYGHGHGQGYAYGGHINHGHDHGHGHGIQGNAFGHGQGYPQKGRY